MQQEQRLRLIAQDMHEADIIATIDDYLEVLNRSVIWYYDWGVILADDNNIHMHIMTSFRKKVFLRKPLREVATQLFNKYKVIKTQILKKPEVLEFDLRMGWKYVSEDGLLIYLEMRKEDFCYE